MHKYLLYAFSHSNVSAAFSCISRGTAARKSFTLSLMDLVSSRVMQVIFEIIRRSVNFLHVLSLKLKSLRLASKEAIPGALVAAKPLKIGYKWGETLSHSNSMDHEMVNPHPENTSEPTMAFPEGTSGEAAEHILGK